MLYLFPEILYDFALLWQNKWDAGNLCKKGPWNKTKQRGEKTPGHWKSCGSADTRGNLKGKGQGWLPWEPTKGAGISYWAGVCRAVRRVGV